MQASNIVNTIVDEAHGRTYVILAPRVLTDGEIYKTIRQEILRRGGRPLANGETVTLTITASGGISSVAQLKPQTGALSLAAPDPNEGQRFTSPPDPVG